MSILIKKTIIVLITIIMVSNFIMPNEVHAGWTEVGKELINGLFDLLRFIADLFLQVMQKMMVGVWSIDNYNGGSEIQYSPGIIFLNRVAGLKINFIGATKSDAEERDNNTALLENDKELIATLKKVYNAKCNKEIVGEWKLKNDKVTSFSGIYGIDSFKNDTIIESNKFESQFSNSDLSDFGIEYVDKILFAGDGYSYNAGGAVMGCATGIVFTVPKADSNLYTLKTHNDDCNDWMNCYFQKSDGKKVESPHGAHLGYHNEGIATSHEFKENDTGKTKDGTIIFDTFVGGGNSYTNNNTTYYPLSSQFWIYDGYLYVSYTFAWGEEVESSSNSIYHAKTTLTRYNVSNLDFITKVKKEATSYALQGTIATWYQALRTVALVGLLSVLVYIGIRIILSSSSAQDKAKYKNMLKDWLVAICILFMLHYIMAFMLGVTQNLNEIIQNNVAGTTLDGNTYDKLMSTVRDEANKASEFNEKISESFGYTVMYLALVILTFVFTFQYLKRVVFMAFLTMIAPMIALTYPLDKIKDGKAQAFSFWLREYIFNCLIQPVHLLLYTVLISSAFSFATENILYAIAALAFMVPAEKFIKEMFGMKSQSPTGQLGAAAGGAMVMSMLNKIKAKPPKEGAEGAGAGASGVANGVRTATRNVGGAVASAAGGNNTNNGGANTPTGPNNPTGANATGASNTNNAGRATASSSGRGSRINAAAKKNIYGWDAIKSNGKKFTKGFGRGVGGAALGLAAGTAALATQVATGDILEDPLKAGAAVAGTTAVGYHAGSNLVGSGLNNVKNLTEGAKKLTYGEEAYSNRQFDKKFFSSESYKTITEDSSIDQTNIKARTQEFLDNGITDVNDIRKALQSGVSGDEYKAMTNMGMDKKDISAFAKIKGSSAARGLGASEIAARMQIAKNLPPQLYKDRTGFVRFAKRYGIDEAEAKRLFKDIDKFI